MKGRLRETADRMELHPEGKKEIAKTVFFRYNHNSPIPYGENRTGGKQNERVFSPHEP